MFSNRQISEKLRTEDASKREFINELLTVSGALAVWAQDKIFIDRWSIEDVKIQIRNAMQVCNRS